MERLFYRGEYGEILRRTIDSPEGRYQPGEVRLIVGALCFHSRLDEAEALFRKHRKQLSGEETAESQFFLGMGFCRHSRYEKAREFFTDNARRYRHAGHRCAFFVFQGMGFYRYFSGNFSSALRCAEKAWACSIVGRFLYAKALSSDLMGHSLVQTGRVHPGLEKLEQAIRYASLMGNNSLADVFRISLVIYRAEFGNDGRKAIAALERHARTVASLGNTYSQASLLMELSRQWALRGNPTKAIGALRKARELVLSSGHRRYEAVLYLREALICQLSGRREECFLLVDKSLALLEPGVDRAIEREATELRKGGVLKATTVSAVLASGYYGLIHESLGLSRSGKVLHVDTQRGRVIIIDRGDVEIVESMSKSLLLLIGALARGRGRKEDLIREIWGYAQYAPLRHDPVIYRAISRLRGALGRGWLCTEQGAYGFAGDVQVSFAKVSPAPSPSTSAEGQRIVQEPLNFRQLRLLEELRAKPFVDVKVGMSLFPVSDMTARRDLSGLVKLRLAKRIGRGRATKYVAYRKGT